MICDLKVSCSKLNRSWLILIILLDGQKIRAKVTYRDNEIEIFYNGQNLGEFYYALYVVFCCTLGIYNVERPEDGQKSDRNL